MPAEPLKPTAIAANLRTTTLPRAIRCFGSVGSTMDLARDWLYEATEAEVPLLVTAEEQTAGRGRRGRSWVAPYGSALLLSLGLRPTWLAPERAAILVQLAAVALCEAIEATTTAQIGLKWPNDVLDRTTEAKLAGILLEVSSHTGGLAWAILGMGINVHAAPPGKFTRYPAACIDQLTGGSTDRLALLRALLQRIDYWHQALQAGAEGDLFAAWRGRLLTLGRVVQVETNDGVIAGVAEDVDAQGALLVRRTDGGLSTITSGDVS